MRILGTILVSIAFFSTKAQSHLPINTGGYGHSQWGAFSPLAFPLTFPDNGNLNHKWQVQSFTSLSAGYIFLNGGISFLSAPVGLALVHPLNKNISAFAAVSATPAIFGYNPLYSQSAINPSYPGSIYSKPYNFGLNARVEGGLMYTNDAKTFSISGSVGIERGSYPSYPSNRPNTKKQ